MADGCLRGGRRTSGVRGWTALSWFASVVVLFVVVAAPISGVSQAAQPAVWNIVALGDSDTTGEGDALKRYICGADEQAQRALR